MTRRESRPGWKSILPWEDEFSKSWSCEHSLPPGAPPCLLCSTFSVGSENCLLVPRYDKAGGRCRRITSIPKQMVQNWENFFPYEAEIKDLSYPLFTYEAALRSCSPLPLSVVPSLTHNGNEMRLGKIDATFSNDKCHRFVFPLENSVFIFAFSR